MQVTVTILKDCFPQKIFSALFSILPLILIGYPHELMSTLDKIFRVQLLFE